MANRVPLRDKISTHPFTDFMASIPPTGKRFVSTMYCNLMGKYENLSLYTAWRRDLGIDEEGISWKSVWSNISTSSRNPNHQLIHFKLCHRMHYTPITRYCMKRVNSPNCDMCQLGTLGTYLHMVWECPQVKDFWQRVTGVLANILDVFIPMNPTLILLNDFDEHLDISMKQKRILSCGLTAAKKVLVQRWLPPHDLSSKKWLSYFHDVILLERSAAKINRAQASTMTTLTELATKIKVIISGN